MKSLAYLLWPLFLAVHLYAAETISIGRSITVEPGPVNRVIVQHDDKSLAVYGAPENRSTDTILFTHHRRDVVSAGVPAVQNGAKAIVPKSEESKFTDPKAFWTEFTEKRFHDYAQQSTKILTEPIPVNQAAEGGSSIDWNGLQIQVIDTPGYTRGAVSYLIELDGKRIAFTGDLIYGNGHIIDLYSLQDAIPEAKIRGYHGYAGRIADVIQSLKTIAGRKPDILIPARGPVIENPQEAIAKLIERLRAVYRNYLTIDALRWYFGDEHIQACADRVFEPSTAIDWMPMAEHHDVPDWIRVLGNSRLLLSESGAAFMIDCGYEKLMTEIQDLIDEGEIKGIDGLYITHYHDDHTDMADAYSKHFHCPVYACEFQRDILEHPSAYRMPAMTDHPIENLKAMPEGETLRWHEFTMTFFFYPGQALYHGALLVKKDNTETVFFIGDSFTPSGIDDYCLLNRNLMHEGMGYLYCLEFLKTLPPDTLLVNQHVPPVFHYTGEQINFMLDTYHKRIELLRELFPWDDPNYGIDEGWARFYPYGLNIDSNEPVSLSVRIMNHSDRERDFYIRPHAPEGITVLEYQPCLRLAPGETGMANILLNISPDADRVSVVTADIGSDGMKFMRWCEALIERNN